MNSISFIFVLIPLGLLVHFLSVILIYNLNFKTPYEPISSVYIRTLILSVALPLTIHLIKLLTRYRSSFKRYYFPVVDELLRIACVYYISLLDKLNFKQITIIYFNFNLINLVIRTVNVCPIHYKEKYEEFLRYYQIFSDYEAFHELNNHANGKQEYLKVLESIINDNVDENDNKRGSISTFKSDETLINRISIHSLPSTLNINNNSDGSPPKPKPIAFLNHDSNLNQTCINVIDKLYSISPKNTFHLNTVTADALSDQDDSIDRAFNNDSIEHLDPSTYSNWMGEEIDSNNGNIDDIHVCGNTHFGGGGGGNLKYQFPDGSKLKFGGGAGFDYQHSDDDEKSTTVSSNVLIRCINWFGWLFPFLPLNKKKKIKNNSDGSESSYLLKQKLSNYTLNSSKDNESIKTLNDLECQSFKNDSADKFNKFEDFINYYFNYSINENEILIDPLFKKFNHLINEIPIIYILIDLANYLAWNFISFLIISIYFLNYTKHSYLILVGLYILKLFELNHLKYSFRNFKVNIVLLFFIHLITGSLAYVYLLVN